MELSNIVWRKSSYSGSNGGECVELAHMGEAAIGIRDSKNPATGHLTVSAAALGSLLNEIRAGKHSL